MGSDFNRTKGIPHFQIISIHAARVGSDCSVLLHNKQAALFHSPLPVWAATYSEVIGNAKRMDFNPRCPCGQRLTMDLLKKGLEEFQSTLPVWAATRGVYVTQMPAFISIHAARVGSDRKKWWDSLPVEISIHAARVGSDFRQVPTIPRQIFQSTLPVWAATRSLRYRAAVAMSISIHAARVGSD